MHQALALSRALQSAWLFLSPASAQGRACLDMPRPPATFAHSCWSKPSGSAARLHGAGACTAPGSSYATVRWWLVSRAVTCARCHVDMHWSHVFHNLDERTDSNTTGDRAGCSGTHPPTLGPKDPAEGPTQRWACTLTPAVSHPDTEKQAMLAPLSQLCPQMWPNAEAAEAQSRAGRQGKGNAAIPKVMRHGEPGSRLPASHGKKH